MNNEFKKFCSLELALQLKEKNFNLTCEYVYVNKYRVKDEIIEQYPRIKGGNYYKLTIDGGGNLKEDEVYTTYIGPVRRWCFNSLLDEKDNGICTMPTLDDARTWLRDNFKFHVVITPEADYYHCLLILPNQFGFVGVGGATVQIYNPEVEPSHYKATVFATYEDALQTALIEAMKYIDKWNKV